MAFDDLLGFPRGARLLGVRAEVDDPGWPVVRFTVLTLIQRCFRTSTLATESHYYNAAFMTMRVSHVENSDRLWNEFRWMYALIRPSCSASSASSLLRNNENAARKSLELWRMKTGESASGSPASAR